MTTTKDLVDPERLSSAIAQSGIWLEALLAQTATNPLHSSDLSLDLKAQLLHLAEQIRTADQTHPPATRPTSLQALASESALPPALPPKPAEPTGNPIRPPTSPNSQSRPVTPQERGAPERLYAAMTQSGLWLEALMAQTTAHPARASDRSLDLKAQLLCLAEQIRTADQSPSSSGPTPQARTVVPAGATPNALPLESAAPDSTDHPRLPDPNPPQARSVAPEPNPASHRTHDETPHSRATAPEVLAKEVDGMIKQVVTQQLRSLEAGTDQPQWILELPFKTPSGLTALEADIRRENRSDQSEDDGWSMRIRLNLPRLGPLSINLSLRLDRLHAGLQAENETGANILRQHLETLRQQLLDRKIEVASLHASHRPGGSPQPARRSPMVSERA
ncbi:flagellar hook-length control protein FliK [Thiocystis minor]|uniref:flagellar hook-length control protein FliK n=1 Tax=Thiocystis minor TaxID=61597 RepID=UPI001A916D96|nr:flagellar hook-length control protein FliK [Thiocystis minor]